MAATRTSRILAFAFFLLLSVSAVSAFGEQLNVTLQETVNQNVTFAENFLLEENRTYSVINGILTVTNSNLTNPLYDVYVYLENVTYLLTDFVYQSGRSGSQVIYPNLTLTPRTVTKTLNQSNYHPLFMDLDEDGINDSVIVNDTHIIFNVSSEWRTREIAFYNSTNTSLNISVAGTVLNMTVNLTSLREDEEYNEDVLFANITINGTITTAGNLTLGEVSVYINDSIRTYAVIHIPELRVADDSVFYYNISNALVDPPLDIDSAYTNAEFQTKVLAGERFWVRLTATNAITVGALRGINITLQAQQVNVSNGSNWEIFNFTLHNLSQDGSISADWTNVTNASTPNANRTWNWIVNGGTLEVGNYTNISFQIGAPYTVGSSGTLLALMQTLQYSINATASQLYIDQIRVRSDIEFNTTKQIVSPQDNNSNNNVTWRSDPKVGTTRGINYTLEKVTLWVTSNTDPNLVEDGLTTDYTSSVTFDSSSPWSGSAWYFNFTDGSSDANPPPIVWIKPYWIIRNTANQIVNSSATVNGTDLYLNYIYVVNGYWLEVQKRVIDAGDDVFNIQVEVRNRGNGYTPQNMTVTVYDFIANEFTAWNFSSTANNQSNVTGEFTGIAYRWDVGLRTNLSTSFAPKNDATGLDYWYLNYTVNGTGDFTVSDLYIVGLDPRLVDGANAFLGVNVLSAIASTNREVIYATIVVFLIVINIANFLMTSKISRKLDEK